MLVQPPLKYNIIKTSTLLCISGWLSVRNRQCWYNNTECPLHSECLTSKWNGSVCSEFCNSKACSPKPQLTWEQRDEWTIKICLESFHCKTSAIQYWQPTWTAESTCTRSYCVVLHCTVLNIAICKWVSDCMKQTVSCGGSGYECGGVSLYSLLHAVWQPTCKLQHQFSHICSGTCENRQDFCKIHWLAGD